MPISFDVTRDESEIINAIAKRAHPMARQLGIKRCTIMDLSMDITATHANGNPLRLQQLLDADDANFGHDVFGIRRHLDRDTGKLQNCFVPRFSA